MDGIKILFFSLHSEWQPVKLQSRMNFSKQFCFLYTFENLAHSDETSLKQVINAAFLCQYR